MAVGLRLGQRVEVFLGGVLVAGEFFQDRVDGRRDAIGLMRRIGEGGGWQTKGTISSRAA